jgi:hypothetical protein
MIGEKLRDCAICGQPVISRPYQAKTARTCSPMCAHTLAAREHPDLRRVDDIVGPRGGEMSS